MDRRTASPGGKRHIFGGALLDLRQGAIYLATGADVGHLPDVRFTRSLDKSTGLSVAFTLRRHGVSPESLPNSLELAHDEVGRGLRRPP